MSSNLPTINNIKLLSKSRLFKVEELDITFPNGSKRIYERVSPSDESHLAVLIVPMLDSDTILLIKEYSAGVERYTLSFPKGAIDHGEPLFIAANRELMEEVGYSAKKYTFIKDVYLSPNYMQHNISIVKAEILEPRKLKGDEPEPLEVVCYKLKNIDKLLSDPDFIECRSLAALFHVWRDWVMRNGK